MIRQALVSPGGLGNYLTQEPLLACKHSIVPSTYVLIHLLERAGNVTSDQATHCYSYMVQWLAF